MDKDLRTLVIAQLIHDLRRARGYTQTELAVRSAVAPSTIIRLESGRFMPSVETLFQVAEGLSLQVSTIFSLLELGPSDDLRAIGDLLGQRSARDRRRALRVLTAFCDALDEPED